VEPTGSQLKYTSLTQLICNQIALLILRSDGVTVEYDICCIKPFTLRRDPTMTCVHIIQFVKYHNVTAVAMEDLVTVTGIKKKDLFLQSFIMKSNKLYNKRNHQLTISTTSGEAHV
jgi:hypothetical protein